MQINARLPHANRVPALPALLALALALVCLVFGAALAYGVAPALLIAGPILLALVAWLFYRPDAGAIVLLAIAWSFVSDVAVKRYHLPSLTLLLSLVLAAAVLTQWLRGWRVSLVFERTSWWMLAYLLVLCLGLWFAAAPDSVASVAWDFTKSLLIFILLVNFINTTKAFERGMWVLLGVGALLGTLTLFQELTKTYDTDYWGLARLEIAQIANGIADRPRAGGPIGDPNTYAQLLVVLVPIGLWGLLQARRPLERIAAGYAVFACLAGIVLSFSRGGYLALALTLALFALHVHLNLRYLLLIVPVAAGLWWFAPQDSAARFGTLQELLPGNQGAGVYSEASYLNRYVSMRMAINMFADHPIQGVGAGNYGVHYLDYIREDGSPTTNFVTVAHSYYLEIAAETGLLGLLVVGGVIVLALSRQIAAEQLFRASGDRRMAELAAALRAGFVGYLVAAAFLPGSYTRYLWIQVALAVALAEIARRQARRHSPLVLPALARQVRSR